jgi:hypothetical protein
MSLSQGKRAKEGGKGKGKGKERERVGESDEEHDTGDNGPMDIVPTPSAPSAPASASASASVSAPPVSKRKYSALDDTESAISGSRDSAGSGSKKRKGPNITAMDGLNNTLSTISLSLRDMNDERRLRRLQIDTRAQAHAQAQQQVVSSSPQRREQARTCLVENESDYLPADHMAALVDLISDNTSSADAYLSLRREDHRHAWLDRQLGKMGYIKGVSADDSGGEAAGDK